MVIFLLYHPVPVEACSVLITNVHSMLFMAPFPTILVAVYQALLVFEICIYIPNLSVAPPASAPTPSQVTISLRGVLASTLAALLYQQFPFPTEVTIEDYQTEK